jgi:hypothetical protein
MSDADWQHAVNVWIERPAVSDFSGPKQASAFKHGIIAGHAAIFVQG